MNGRQPRKVQKLERQALAGKRRVTRLKVDLLDKRSEILSARQLLHVANQIPKLDLAPDTMMTLKPPQAADFGALDETPDIALEVGEDGSNDLGLKKRIVVGTVKQGVAELGEGNSDDE